MHLLRMRPGSLVSRDGSAPPFAQIHAANLAQPMEQLPPIAVGVPPLVLWSGSFGPPPDPARGLFPRDFRAWTREGRDALDAACGPLAPELARRGVELVLHPHARHILADPQACLSFLRHREGVRLLLDPAAFMMRSMLARAEDHLERIFESLGDQPSIAAVVLTNAQRIDRADDDGLGPSPLHAGLIDTRLIISAWRPPAPPELPVALIDHDFDEQAALLA